MNDPVTKAIFESEIDDLRVAMRSAQGNLASGKDEDLKPVWERVEALTNRLGSHASDLDEPDRLVLVKDITQIIADFESLEMTISTPHQAPLPDADQKDDD